jgi:hypothetical protein
VVDSNSNGSNDIDDLHGVEQPKDDPENRPKRYGLGIKDHYKPVRSNGRHPTWLIVSAHNFTQCLSKLASKLIENAFWKADVNFEHRP